MFAELRNIRSKRVRSFLQTYLPGRFSAASLKKYPEQKVNSARWIPSYGNHCAKSKEIPPPSQCPATTIRIATAYNILKR